MTQQDQRAAFEAQIELPPLPEPDQYTWYSRNLVESILRQAIAQDRQQQDETVAAALRMQKDEIEALREKLSEYEQQRGEAVAEVQLHSHDASVTVIHPLVDFEPCDVGTKLYLAPQPADPVKDEPTREAIAAAWREACGKVDHETIRRMYRAIRRYQSALPIEHHWRVVGYFQDVGHFRYEQVGDEFKDDANVFPLYRRGPQPTESDTKQPTANEVAKAARAMGANTLAYFAEWLIRDTTIYGTGMAVNGQRVEPEKIYAAEPVKVPSFRDIISFSDKWSKEPGFCEFERNDFVGCVREILARYGQPTENPS